MDVASLCLLPASSILWQPRAGAWVLTVITKATFQLKPGESPLAQEQEPIFEHDRTRGADATSLWAPSDLAPMKPRTDVLVVGSAFAPNKQPVRSLVARLAVGSIDKSVEVVCDRTQHADGAVVEGPPFARMSLAYERAAGGPDTANPVGVRPDTRDASGHLVLPNLKRPAGARVPEGPKELVSLGPIAWQWPTRREKLGRNASSWSPREWSQRPLPEDHNPAFFNAAPADQQGTSLREDERITLENLHPDHPQLVTSLPGLQVRVMVEGRGVGGRPLTMRCDTLWIDTDRSLCTLVWRGQLPLQHPQESGRIIVSLEKQSSSGEAGKKPSLSGTVVDAPGAPRAAGPALPFAQTAQPPKPPPQAPVPSDTPPPPQPVFVQPPQQATESSPWAAGSPRPSVDIAPPIATPPIVTPPIVTLPKAISTPPDPPRARPEPARPAPPAEPPPEYDILHLLWFDPDSVPRLRKRPAFRKLLDELDKHPVDPALDDPAITKEPLAVEERREVLEILAAGKAEGAEAVTEALSTGVRDKGKFAPELLLLAGDLTLPFDELKTLKATITTVTPLAGNDEALKAAIEAGKELLKLPDPVIAPAVVEGSITRIKEAFAQGKRSNVTGYIDAQTERALLEQRHYQKRLVFGAPHLRALLHVQGSQQPIPTYLPEKLAQGLPLYQRFSVRLCAEVHMQVDQYETHAAALKVVAIGRTVQPKR